MTEYEEAEHDTFAAVQLSEGRSLAPSTEPAETSTAQPVWEAPAYDFGSQSLPPPPRWSARSSQSDRGILRTARWCVDGSATLTTSEDRTVRVYFTPDSATSDPAAELKPYLDLPQAAPVLSALWYPTGTPSAPERFCYAVTIRDSPARLMDGLTGLTRATYPIVDHRERFIAPFCLAWNPSATKLYCGHENAIEVLDISAPGYDTSERIKTTLTRGDKGGQKGIISALAFSTDYSGSYAAGSFGGSVSLYSEDEAGAVGHLEGVEGGGVTQLAFHPLSPNHLFVASRRSSLLQVFDLRNPTQPFHSFPRPASSNQRMSFDLDPWGRWLAIGDETGKVGIWDVGGGGQWGEKLWEAQVANIGDAISSVQFHPLKPSLLVSSGSRHVDLRIADSDPDSDDSSYEDSSESGDPYLAGSSGRREQSINGRTGADDHVKAGGIGAGLGILDFGQSV